MDSMEGFWQDYTKAHGVVSRGCFNGFLDCAGNDTSSSESSVAIMLFGKTNPNSTAGSAEHPEP
jgi:hypothetical protein